MIDTGVNVNNVLLIIQVPSTLVGQVEHTFHQNYTPKLRTNRGEVIFNDQICSHTHNFTWYEVHGFIYSHNIMEI